MVFFFFRVAYVDACIGDRIFINLVVSFRVPYVSIVDDLVFVFRLVHVHRTSELLVGATVYDFSTGVVDVRHRFPFLKRFSVMRSISCPLVVIYVEVSLEKWVFGQGVIVGRLTNEVSSPFIHFLKM